MDILDRVAALKAQAIDLLLAERKRIDNELLGLGYEKNASAKRRGRPPRQEASELIASHSETIRESDPSTPS